MKIVWILIAFISGILLPVQAGLNARLGRSIESPVYASLVSFLTGTVVLLLYIVITRQPVSWSGFRTAPSYVWIAGLFGAFYVTATVLVFPRLGPALTFALIVLGQMVMALVLDHFNILVAGQHAITPLRLLGVVLIIAGVVIIRRF